MDLPESLLFFPEKSILSFIKTLFRLSWSGSFYVWFGFRLLRRFELLPVESASKHHGVADGMNDKNNELPIPSGSFYHQDAEIEAV